MGEEIGHYYYSGESEEYGKSNTREEILEAALDLFSINGYEATGISQLATHQKEPKDATIEQFRNADLAELQTRQNYENVLDYFSGTCDAFF